MISNEVGLSLFKTGTVFKSIRCSRVLKKEIGQLSDYLGSKNIPLSLFGGPLIYFFKSLNFAVGRGQILMCHCR